MMNPNQTINVDQRPGSDIVFRDKPSKSKGMIAGMVVLALLAVGGIGFGVWAMMDGNSQKEQLNGKISDLESEIVQKNDKISELESKSSSSSVQQQQEYLDEGQGEFTIIEIGDCIMDSGTVEDGAKNNEILKCRATTSNGEGIFTWDSDSNRLRFVLESD